ncbi:hypothetical protein [Streptomyces sp. NPDC051572]|jgi:hypothetical protein|uniref:hypothetical protein n=1 Tax=Streptomyces sp. NPDC051572 TaxID=3155802 RepID=UPI00344B1908
MPSPVQLVAFDESEREVLLQSAQPRAIDSALRAVAARVKEHLRNVAELGSDKAVGASHDRLTAARSGIEQALRVLEVCPAGEVADLRTGLQGALALIDEALALASASDPTLA